GEDLACPHVPQLQLNISLGGRNPVIPFAGPEQQQAAVRRKFADGNLTLISNLADGLPRGYADQFDCLLLAPTCQDLAISGKVAQRGKTLLRSDKLPPRGGVPVT